MECVWVIVCMVVVMRINMMRRRMLLLGCQGMCSVIALPSAVKVTATAAVAPDEQEEPGELRCQGNIARSPLWRWVCLRWSLGVFVYVRVAREMEIRHQQHMSTITMVLWLSGSHNEPCVCVLL